jgi:hypothetical protein
MRDQAINFLRLAGIFICAGLTILFTGCQSTSGSRHMASVMIPDRTAEEIRRTTVEVFRADGYHDIAPTPGAMTFEKTGTGWNQAAYGGWTDAKPVTVRVKAGVETQPDGANRLWCDAYMVGDAGHSLFEEEHKLTKMRRGPYKDLLEKVAEQLKFSKP